MNGASPIGFPLPLPLVPPATPTAPLATSHHRKWPIMALPVAVNKAPTERKSPSCIIANLLHEGCLVFDAPMSRSSNCTLTWLYDHQPLCEFHHLMKMSYILPAFLAHHYVPVAAFSSQTLLQRLTIANDHQHVASSTEGSRSLSYRSRSFLRRCVQSLN